MASNSHQQDLRMSNVNGIRYYGSSPSQFLNVLYPRTHADSYPLAIVLHGGFWKSKYGINPPTAACETIALDLRDHGFIVVEVEYRRDGDEQWGWPHTNNDILIAFRTAVTLPHVNGSKVCLIGHSAGGTLALWLAARLRRDQEKVFPRRTYALAPVADLREAVRLRLSDEGDAVIRFMHGTPEDMPSQYDEACPTYAAAELARLNITLVAGKDDGDVPPAIVKRLHKAIIKAAAKAEPKVRGTTDFNILPETNHYDLVLASSAAWKAVKRHILETFLEVERPQVDLDTGSHDLRGGS